MSKSKSDLPSTPPQRPVSKVPGQMQGFINTFREYENESSAQRKEISDLQHKLHTVMSFIDAKRTELDSFSRRCFELHGLKVPIDLDYAHLLQDEKVVSPISKPQP